MRKLNTDLLKKRLKRLNKTVYSFAKESNISFSMASKLSCGSYQFQVKDEHMKAMSKTIKTQASLLFPVKRFSPIERKK